MDAATVAPLGERIKSWTTGGSETEYQIGDDPPMTSALDTWTKTSERLPESSGPCWVVVDGGVDMAYWYAGPNDGYWLLMDRSWDWCVPTHWIAFQEPPMPVEGE